MRIAIIFDAPDELASTNFSPEEFLQACHEKIFDIKIDAIIVPEQYKMKAQEPFMINEPQQIFEMIPPIVSDKILAEEKKRVDKEARDRRQQHKLAVKFSNRRK